MPHLIEEKGTEILKKELIARGRDVKKSDNKTFDLIVDGHYIEVKTKHKPYSKIDFVSFTDKQYAEILKSEFGIFLVCNVDNPDSIEIKEFKSSDFRKSVPKKYTSYEFNKSVLDGLVG